MTITPVYDLIFEGCSPSKHHNVDHEELTGLLFDLHMQGIIQPTIKLVGWMVNGVYKPY